MSRFSPTVRAYDPQTFEHLQSSLRFAGDRQTSLAAQEQAERRTAEAEKSGEAYRQRLKQQEQTDEMLRQITMARAYRTLGLKEDAQYGHEPVPAQVRAPLGAQEGPVGAREMAGANIPKYELGDARNRIQLGGGWSINKMGEAPSEEYELGLQGQLAELYRQSGADPAEAALRSRGAPLRPDYLRDKGFGSQEEYEQALRTVGQNDPAMFVEQFRAGVDEGPEHPLHSSYREDTTGSTGWGDSELMRGNYYAAWGQAYMQKLGRMSPLEAWMMTNAEAQASGAPMLSMEEWQNQIDKFAGHGIRRIERGGTAVDLQGVGPEGNAIVNQYLNDISGGMDPIVARESAKRAAMAAGMDAALVDELLDTYGKGQAKIGPFGRIEDYIGSGIFPSIRSTPGINPNP